MAVNRLDIEEVGMTLTISQLIHHLAEAGFTHGADVPVYFRNAEGDDLDIKKVKISGLGPKGKAIICESLVG